jgi:uncharacterized protein with FMN-binding domain
MRRALTALVATIAGVVWLVTFRITPNHAVAAPTSPPAQAGHHDVVATLAPPSPTPTPQGVSGSFTGSTVSTIFGDVQVSVVVSGGRVVDVKSLQLPFDRPRSAEISQIAGPMLRSEAIQAHTAQIDIVSGATYTSEAYAQSLASALQQAHLG